MKPHVAQTLRPILVLLCGCLNAWNVSHAADAPSIKLALSFRPVQKQVECETPKESEYAKCKVKVERHAKASGWVVLGPAGQPLRRFVDTNGDNVVDQWRYYKDGLEVYRDIDGDFNNKVDQSRWLNTGGSRWALDSNEDGRIDGWKVLSAEAASREAVRALAAGEKRTLSTVLINADDVRTLGIGEAVAKKLLEAVSDPGKKMTSIRSRSKVLSSQSRWRNFDSSSPPGTIPVEDGKATQDLTVYANAMAIIETGGKTGFVQIGEMVRVGDVWKLTQIPHPLEGDSPQVSVGGILMQPTFASAASLAASNTTVTPQMQKLLGELQELDRNSPAPTAGRAALARYNSKRADLLSKLVEKSGSDEERNQWTRQMVDGLATAVQTGGYPEGLARLKTLEADARKTSPKSPMVAYIFYRRLLAEYYQKLQEAGTDTRGKLQEWWLKQLEQFVNTFPDSDDAPEALWQLAITQEFSGKLTTARRWYDKLINQHADSNAGSRAAGALRRLDLKGKLLTFSGPGLDGQTINVADYRGKVLLVAFWATWCKPCTEDLPQVRALYKQHHDQGFEILGVNLDMTSEPISEYLKKHQVTWPQIHQPGGLVDSEPAKAFGIISLPTMFLVDADGKVISRATSVADLKTQLPELLKKK